MSFEADGPVPEWVTQRFDSHTRLPLGPLEHLPVPVEGQITSAGSCIPSDGSPASWEVRLSCVETLEEALEFFQEYLPFAGYEVVAVGDLHARRWWRVRTTETGALVVIRRGAFIGTAILRTTAPTTAGALVATDLEPPDSARRRMPTELTEVVITMAPDEHPKFHPLGDVSSLRALPQVRWRHCP